MESAEPINDHITLANNKGSLGLGVDRLDRRDGDRIGTLGGLSDGPRRWVFEQLLQDVFLRFFGGGRGLIVLLSVQQADEAGTKDNDQYERKVVFRLHDLILIIGNLTGAIFADHGENYSILCENFRKLRRIIGSDDESTGPLSGGFDEINKRKPEIAKDRKRATGEKAFVQQLPGVS